MPAARRRVPRVSLALPFALTLAALLFAPLSAQFQMQDSGTTADLRGIVNVGNGTAWASGTHGTVLRTEDSGFVWQGCATPPGAENLDFRGIQAFDDQTAIVMSSGKGELSRVYKTTDGCKTWTLVFTNPDADGFFDAVSLAPAQAWEKKEFSLSHTRGEILGDPVDKKFAIFTTSDSGSTWTRRERERRKEGGACDQEDVISGKAEAAFAASNQSLVSYGSEDFLFVTGGGASELVYLQHSGFDYNICRQRSFALKLPLAQGESSQGAFAFAVKRVGDGADYLPVLLVVVGGDYKHPDDPTGTAASLIRKHGISLPYSLAYSVVAPQHTPHGYRSSVAYDGKTKMWITVGPNGTDISTDDGRNWRALKPEGGDDPNADKQWNALSLPYVVGPHGRIGRLRTDALTPKQ